MTGDHATTGAATTLGATLDDKGANFALFSSAAEAVDLCLFGDVGDERRIRLPGRTDNIFHGHIAGVRAGQRYGYRVHGPYDPAQGLRFNPAKLLIDPYAKRLDGALDTSGPIFGHAAEDNGPDHQDSVKAMPKSVVLAPSPRRDHRRPHRSWNETIIYEAHLAGLTRLHPAIPDELRGTWEALAHPVVVEHLNRIGVTTLELLPVHAFSPDHFLSARGLANYWGYSTLSYFAPHARYLGPNGEDGIRDAVATLHRAGIEVILDVVYNHTAELDALGPTLSFRGIDNAAYYRLDRADLSRYVNDTGCGHVLNCSHPVVAELVLESLGYWAGEFGIDGFRFDLAPILGRDADGFSTASPLLKAIVDDPGLAGLKIVAEPWDIGTGGYQLGGFPLGWSEWNDGYRDAVRRTWRGDDGSLPILARALTGSREIFEPSGRGPEASVNFVACHDGFTLDDLVSYERKHNEANCEGNRDGADDNHSANHGVEGPSNDPAIIAARARTKRNLLATLFLSTGVPMLGMGDELSRSQGGNNNAYCQDNKTTWLDWRAGERHDPALPGFVSALAALRRRLPALRRTRFFTGQAQEGHGPDIRWLAPDARPMNDGDWNDPRRSTLGVEWGGDDPADTRLLLLVNIGPDEGEFRLPTDIAVRRWRLVLDTAADDPFASSEQADLTGTIALASRSQVLFEDLG